MLLNIIKKKIIKFNNKVEIIKFVEKYKKNLLENLLANYVSFQKMENNHFLFFCLWL